MKELLMIINNYSELDNFGTKDFKIIKEYMNKNNLDTDEIDRFINDIYERCNEFSNKIYKKFNSLSEEQVKTIDLLNENKINWELKDDWDYDKQDYTYKIVVENKEEDK